MIIRLDYPFNEFVKIQSDIVRIKKILIIIDIINILVCDYSTLIKITLINKNYLLDKYLITCKLKIYQFMSF